MSSRWKWELRVENVRDAFGVADEKRDGGE
jgi:hypothetical protein